MTLSGLLELCKAYRALPTDARIDLEELVADPAVATLRELEMSKDRWEDVEGFLVDVMNAANEAEDKDLEVAAEGVFEVMRAAESKAEYLAMGFSGTPDCP